MHEIVSNPKHKRILAVFAHPDDEVFCAGGMLARAVAMDAETMVVSATRGDAGQIRDAQAATRQTLGQVREQELYRSCARLGVRHAACLDYGDGTLQNIEPERLIEDLVRIIRLFRPDAIITFGPDGAYGHPDHIAISVATTEAVKQAGDAGQFPEQLWAGLSPHTPARLYYSYFPHKQRLLSDRLVHWLVDLYRRFQGTVDFAHALMLFSEEATMLGYASDHVETHWFPAGFHMVEQGEPADKLYLILSGQAEVRREDEAGALHRLARIGPGQFFGEEGLAYQRPRNAHVVAVEDVTCLVFSAEAPSNFAGRGAGPQSAEVTMRPTAETQPFPGEIIDLDIGDYVPQKVAAMAAHHTQFPLEPDLLPMSILREMLGHEYFIRVDLPAKLNLPAHPVHSFAAG
jgi:LmbE family N-acetylglucosaminyl deacetylase